MLHLAEGESTNRGYGELRLPFLFDFNDIGLIQGSVKVSIIKLKSGQVDFKVTDAVLNEKTIQIGKKFFLQICNDRSGKIYNDLAKLIINTGGVNG